MDQCVKARWESWHLRRCSHEQIICTQMSPSPYALEIHSGTSQDVNNSRRKGEVGLHSDGDEVSGN